MIAVLGHATDGTVGPTLGPWPFVVLTYDLLRAGTADGDALTIAHLTRDGLWRLTADGTRWTDITLLPDEEASDR